MRASEQTQPSLLARIPRACFAARQLPKYAFGPFQEKQEVVCWATALHLRRRRFIDPATPLPQNIETHTHTLALSRTHRVSLAAEANVSSRAPATHTPDPQFSLSCRLKSCQPASQPLALILVYGEREEQRAQSASSRGVCIYTAISKIGFFVRGGCWKLIALILIGSIGRGDVI
jgi:hypothetical protein